MKKSIRTIMAFLTAMTVVTGTMGTITFAAGWPEDPEAIMSAKVEDCEMSYKAYDINDAAMFGYKEGDNFADVFTDTLKVYGKYGKGKDNALITYVEKDGKTTFLGAMALENGKVVPDIDEEAEKILNSQKSQVIDMKIGRSKNAKSYIIYFKTDDGEFVVPIFDVEYSFMGDSVYEYIKNGKTYTVDEFVGALKDSCSKYDGLVMGDADGNGTVNVRDCATMAKAFANPSGSVQPSISWDYNMDDIVNVRDCAAVANDLAN